MAALGPLAEGKSALQVLIAGFLMNLRFLPMSAALAPYFCGARRLALFLSSQVISASSFIVPYLHFQKEREISSGHSLKAHEADGRRNLYFFLGVGTTSLLVWVVGTAVGYGVALAFPPGFEEALRFMLPGYFAGLLVVEMRGRVMPVICLASLIGAIPGVWLSPGWGWLVTALAIAIVGWAIEQWFLVASKSS